jgi:hypothetical protein
MIHLLSASWVAKIIDMSSTYLTPHPPTSPWHLENFCLAFPFSGLRTSLSEDFCMGSRICFSPIPCSPTHSLSYDTGF